MPRVRFVMDCDLTVVKDFASYSVPCPRLPPLPYLKKHIKAGDVHLLQFHEDMGKTVDAQFEDGTVAVGLPADLFEILE
jgi:hypothetical protein